MAVLGQIGGALVGGMIADAIGRKRSTVLIAIGYLVFALLDAFSVSMPMLLTARLLIGVTIGVSVVVVPVYVAELAPTALRGSLATAYQVAIVSGIILGYLAGYLLADTHSWRWIFGLAAILAALLLPLLIRMPETARWYVLKGRVADARRALLRVEPEACVEEELVEIASALREARSPGGSAVSSRCCARRICAPPHSSSGSVFCLRSRASTRSSTTAPGCSKPWASKATSRCWGCRH